ncbi:hypothetical protein [Streptomyces sp. NPDC058401]|uniref:hypothetical protein n=1 Tax=Streptomyces sp. NPDC058401 TaxID=3346480 RepID=UPI00364778B2
MKLPLRRRSVGMLLLCACVLTACTDGPDPSVPSAGPTSTSTSAAPSAAALADRYQQSGGDPDVYGIDKEPGTDGGAPRLVIRTRNPDSDDAVFQKQKESIVRFLTREEGLSPTQGYFMDVYGPDGALLHRLDARP